jgi:uncharacterized protein involved in outer membrane biogenesis
MLPYPKPATQKGPLMKKIIAIVAATLVVTVIGVVVYVGSNIDGIVKNGVETYGPRFTGTDVRLGSVSSSLMGGEVSINEFFLGNPKGFKTPYAFKVNKVKVAVDTSSLTGDVVHIKEIIIEAPDIIYEMGGGSSNLQAIQDNVAKATGTTGGSAKASEGGGKKVVIDNLYVRNAKASLSAAILGGKQIPLPLPDLHLKDIGKDEKGASMSDAAKKVLDGITESATSAAGKIDVKGIAAEAGKALEGATKGAKDALEGATQGLKGLFGK